MTDQREFLMEVLKGNEDAVDLCINLGEVSQVWDDLIDGDAVSAKEINNAFIAALAHIPANPFYREFFPMLRPVIEQAIIDWQTANYFEQGENDVHRLNMAFVLRDSLVSVIIMCARIIGGLQYSISVAPAIRCYFHDETLKDYLEGLT